MPGVAKVIVDGSKVAAIGLLDGSAVRVADSEIDVLAEDIEILKVVVSGEKMVSRTPTSGLATITTG